jgi:hypothetical protein
VRVRVSSNESEACALQHYGEGVERPCEVPQVCAPRLSYREVGKRAKFPSGAAVRRHLGLKRHCQILQKAEGVSR